MARQNLSKYKKKAWKACSLYIRRKFADDLGYVSCVTCGNTKHYKELQAGHFIARAQGNSTYFVEENVHPQCYRCNINLGGNGANYYPYMLEMYGQEKIDELKRLSNTTTKFTVADLEEIQKDYTDRLEELR